MVELDDLLNVKKAQLDLTVQYTHGLEHVLRCCICMSVWTSAWHLGSSHQHQPS